jgi:hypothetical protein
LYSERLTYVIVTLKPAQLTTCVMFRAVHHVVGDAI